MWPKTLPPFVRLSVRIRGLRMEQVTDCNPVLKADAVFHPIINKEQKEREAGRCAATQPTGEALRERQSLPGIGCCCLRLINHSRPLHCADRQVAEAAGWPINNQRSRDLFCFCFWQPSRSRLMNSRTRQAKDPTTAKRSTVPTGWATTTTRMRTATGPIAKSPSPIRRWTSRYVPRPTRNFSPLHRLPPGAKEEPFQPKAKCRLRATEPIRSSARGPIVIRWQLV